MVFGQVNICKMSTQSECVLDRFMYTHNVQLLAVQETGYWSPSQGAFSNKKVFFNKKDNGQQQAHLAGVALIVDQNLVPEPISELTDNSVSPLSGYK